MNGLKYYNVETVVGDFKVRGFNESHAKCKAYQEYRQTRNTTHQKFEEKIIKVVEIS